MGGSRSLGVGLEVLQLSLLPVSSLLPDRTDDVASLFMVLPLCLSL